MILDKSIIDEYNKKWVGTMEPGHGIPDEGTGS